MNMADGFGLHVSPASSSDSSNDEYTSSGTRHVQQQRQQQQNSMWGNLTGAIKNTAQYASHEFDRFFDAMGFKTPIAEADYSDRQQQPQHQHQQAVKTKKRVIEPNQASKTTSTSTHSGSTDNRRRELDRYESAASSLTQSRTASDVSSGSATLAKLRMRSSTTMDPARRQRLLELKAQLEQMLEQDNNTESDGSNHIRYTNVPRRTATTTTTSTASTIPTTDNTAAMSAATNTTAISYAQRASARNDENERMDRLERSIERIQAQMHGMISMQHRPAPFTPSRTSYAASRTPYAHSRYSARTETVPPSPQPTATAPLRQPSHDMTHVPAVTPATPAGRTGDSLPSPTSDAPASPKVDTQNSLEKNARIASPKMPMRPIPPAHPASPDLNAHIPAAATSPSRGTKTYASPVPAHSLAGARKVLPSSTLVKNVFRKQSSGPDEKHIDTMQKVVEQIPHVELRRTDMIRSSDGTLKPNPFWIEIYEPRRRYRSKRALESTGSMTAVGEQHSASKRLRTSFAR